MQHAETGGEINGKGLENVRRTRFPSFCPSINERGSKAEGAVLSLCTRVQDEASDCVAPSAQFGLPHRSLNGNLLLPES